MRPTDRSRDIVGVCCGFCCATVSECGFQHGRNDTLLTNYCLFPSIIQSNPKCPRKVLNWNCNCRNQKGSDKFNLFSQIARSTKIRICVLLRIFAYFCGLFAHFLRFTKNMKISKNRWKKAKHINNPSPRDQSKLLLSFPVPGLKSHSSWRKPSLWHHSMDCTAN